MNRDASWSRGWARRDSDGKSIFIDDIISKEDYPKGSLFCLDPQCNTPVHPKIHGKKRRHHFAHYSEQDSKRCRGGWSNGESIEHMTAKHFVATNNSRCCFVDHWCKKCKRRHCVGGTWLLRTEMECRIHTSVGLRIADVMLLDDHGVPAYALEIRHTHAVEPEKTRELLESGVRVLEMDSKEVLLRRDKAAGKKFAKDSLVYQIRLVGYRHVTCVDCAMEEVVQGELREWRNHEKEYERLCEKWWEKRQIEAWKFTEYTWHKRNQQRGITLAKEKICDSYLYVEFEYSCYEGVEKSFKCVGCGKWRLKSKNQIHEVAYSDFCSLNQFRNKHARHKTFQSKTHAEWSYKNWKATVCEFCAMKCPECSNISTMQDLSVYGCCYVCNVISDDESDSE